MPLATIEAQRAYQRQWMADRRSDWFKRNGPCIDCGSWKNLEIDHIDPSKKIDHRVWSWSEQRRVEELSKCVVRCKDCHKKKTAADRAARMKHGTYGMWIGRHCRCELCCVAMRIYKKDYRARTGIH
jgi:hypothetical protein